jgi:hypothetical protein
MGLRTRNRWMRFRWAFWVEQVAHTPWARTLTEDIRKLMNKLGIEVSPQRGGRTVRDANSTIIVNSVGLEWWVLGCCYIDDDHEFVIFRSRLVSSRLEGSGNGVLQGGGLGRVKKGLAEIFFIDWLLSFNATKIGGIYSGASHGCMEVRRVGQAADAHWPRRADRPRR